MSEGRQPSWESRGLGPTLRPWQTHAVATLVDRLDAPAARTCLIAPPGAGKTVCALAIAEHLGLPVEVRVPTTALVQQWEARVSQVLVAVDEGAPPAPVRVSTYAAREPFSAHALVLLDEAHHLTAAWGREVEALLDGSQRVLGLTATPPFGAPGWDRFLGLVGNDPVEIPAPPLVRDGQLCPHHDLVWPVLVDADDLPELMAIDARLRALEESVRPHWGIWETRRLEEDLWTLTEQRFAGESGLLVALVRLRLARGADLPTDLVVDDELRAPPTLHDRALALWAYQPEDKAVLSGLRAAGFRVNKQGPVLVEDVASKGLASSSARVRGAIEVLAHEHRSRGDGLRALVVCDRDVEGERLAARQVLRAFVQDARTDALDPILVTGSVFWIDDDLWGRVEERLPPLPWEAREGHHALDVRGWATADRVALATRLLTEGLTRCLIGTRHLLGEGWDCPAVDCVIDLTGVTASVTVNQVRGRGLRPDPDDPSKVASLWEVVALAPGAPDGGRMLERARERHEHTFGVDERGRIVAGLRRIDPVLTREVEVVAAETEALRARMAERLADGAGVARRWAVGEDYRDARTWRVAGREQGAVRPRLPATAIPELPPPTRTSVVRRRTRERGLRGALVTSALLAGAGLGWAATVTALALTVPLAPLALPASWLGMAAGGGLGAAAGLGLHLAIPSRVDRDRAIQQAVHEALVAAHPDLGALQSDDETVWTDGDDGGRRYADALAELLGPVRHPRYLLVTADGSMWPVPDDLGARRDLADGLAEAWTRRVAPAVAVYARSEQGRAMLQAAWRAGGAARPGVEVVETWE